MPRRTTIALVPRSLGIGEAILRAYECLHVAGIGPIGCTCGDPPTVTVALQARDKAIDALFTAGLTFKEI